MLLTRVCCVLIYDIMRVQVSYSVIPHSSSFVGACSFFFLWIFQPCLSCLVVSVLCMPFVSPCGEVGSA